MRKDGLHPELAHQDTIDRLKNEVLEGLVKNRAMFRTPPSLASLRAISSAWGFVVVGGGSKIEWSQANIWSPEATTVIAQGQQAKIDVELSGVQISRQAIRPVWNILIVPDKDPIDLDFGEEDVGDAGSDILSVASFEIDTATDEQPLHLRDRAARKRQRKAEVRATIARAEEARMAADAAMEGFYEEFDLSEGESDFSDDDV